MKQSTFNAGTLLKRCASMLAFVLYMASSPANAAVMYDFSLPANGSVGAVGIQLTFPDFLPDSDLQVFSLSDPVVTSVTGAPPITGGSIGIRIDPTQTLFGIDLSSDINQVLLTEQAPDDFFVFGRTPTQTDTFASTGGIVISDFPLETATPTGTLVVSAVPEPGTLALLGLGLAGLAATRRRRQ